MKETLLLVDDEEDLVRGLKRTLLRSIGDVEVITTTQPREALALARKTRIDVALVDIKMPEMGGLELLEKLREQDGQLTCVMMTAFGSIELAVDAMRRGAYDFITKPFDKEVLLRVVTKALERGRLLRENLCLKKLVYDANTFSRFVGHSPPLRVFFESLKIIARSDYTVLIRGESGTGKELAARAIHEHSQRGNRPLVMVNCPAIPEHLLESELFGHRRGAFTGANRDQVGLFEEADGGTICLDEIGDIPVYLQTKLLRVLQEQEIKPLGASKTRRIDVRIMAITNQDLERKMAAQTFREDLFYRLNVMSIKTPCLAEIREDIPLLIDHFTRQVCCELHIPEKRFSVSAIALLTRRRWPGNVRELQNMVRRLVMFGRDAVIEVDDLLALGEVGSRAVTVPSNSVVAMETITSYKAAKEAYLLQFTDRYLADLLEKTKGNVTKAAEISGLSRAALQKILRRSSLKAAQFRAAD